MKKPLDIVIAVIKYLQEEEPDTNFLELSKEEQEDILEEAISYDND